MPAANEASTATSSSRPSNGRSSDCDASRSWNLALGDRDRRQHHRRCSCATTGIDPVGLYATRRATAGRHRPGEPGAADQRRPPGARTRPQWTPWLRSVVGVRVDRYDFAVASSIPANAGSRTPPSRSRPSCRWSSVPGPGPSTSSTTATVSTATMPAARRRSVTPREGLPVGPGDTAGALPGRRARRRAPSSFPGCRARWRCGGSTSTPSWCSSATPATPRPAAPAGAAASNGTTTIERGALAAARRRPGAVARALSPTPDPAGQRFPARSTGWRRSAPR